MTTERRGERRESELRVRETVCVCVRARRAGDKDGDGRRQEGRAGAEPSDSAATPGTKIQTVLSVDTHYLLTQLSTVLITTLSADAHKHTHLSHTRSRALVFFFFFPQKTKNGGKTLCSLLPSTGW